MRKQTQFFQPEQTRMNRAPRRRGLGGPGMMPGEKPKNFKKSIGTLLRYMGRYRFGIFAVMIFAACSTVFSVAGPKILGKATTELYTGLMAKIQGTGVIDFDRIGQILLFVLGLYLCSALLSFLQGWIMTGITQKVCYRLRKEISQKINRMPMQYFESRTYGEVLSRITNDVDTLGQGLNQSITTIITATATMIGVLIMMLSISPLMTLIAIIILPVSMTLLGLVTKKSQKFFRAQQEYLGHINGQVEEVYGGHMVIKAFNREKDTIEEFEKTLLTPNSRFDLYLKGEKTAINDIELAGYELFKKYDCATCHVGETLGGQSYELMGVKRDYFADRGIELTEEDNGRFKQTRNERDKHRFKVPGLRNIALTAPYFHDGSMKTMKEAVDYMAKYQMDLNLPEDELNKIVAFLETLTGEYKGKPLTNDNQTKAL